ncbi:hypothetical protein EJB05_28768 [Eragrostis curvula]|uniref:Uncharacterized protein n=1 Tax=Eragrostis curvula TaxID=38414 RepID=A0A5J9USG8_9POAL|nr:hypothetical protein EJB05_28768 [Eragrostis curvula]
MDVGQKLEEVKEALFQKFPSGATLLTKDYEKNVANANETPEKKESKGVRMKGYRSICQYGLGSMFWTAASGVLAVLEEEKLPAVTEKVHYRAIYFAISLGVMLTGLAASTFHDSFPLAPCFAGLGAWKAFMFVLATFHLASFKFHSNVDQCMLSMILSGLVVTFFWALGVQDPLPFHIIAKFIIWLVGVAIWCLVFLLYCIVFALYGIGCFFIWLWDNACEGCTSLKKDFAARFKKADIHMGQATKIMKAG